ncbi:MAG: lysophospholipase [Peptococcaceae bacterium]|nr:lysophospholipase [Peptococcaceae bacterium]
MRIAALGDSITEGYLCYSQDCWVSIVGKELGITMYNLGVSGDLTRNMRRRFRHQVLPLAPSHCLILGGTNDAFCDIEIDDFSENVEIMVEYCINNHIIPILGIPTPCLAYPQEFILQEYRGWLKEYAENNKIQIIDFYSALADTDSMIANQEYLLDEVHPNVEGYRVMADVAKAVISQIAIR